MGAKYKVEAGMEIKKSRFKRCDLLALQGRFDSSTAPELEHALRASLDDGVFRLVVDMGQVEYFGSAAIRAIAGVHVSVVIAPPLAQPAGLRPDPGCPTLVCLRVGGACKPKMRQR